MQVFYRRCIIVISLIILSACQEKSAEEHYQQAQQYYQNKEIKAAGIALKSALQQDPMYTDARYLLGKIYLDLENYPAAEKELKLAKKFGERDPQLLPLLAKALRANASYVELSNLQTQGYQLLPSHTAQVRFYRLQSWMELNKKQRVLDELELIQVQPAGEFYDRLSLIYADLLGQRFLQAKGDLHALLDEQPRNGDVLAMLARTYQIMQMDEEAITAFAQLIAVEPSNLGARFQYVSLLVDNEKFSLAQSELSTLLAIAPNNPELNELLSITLAALSDFSGSLAAAEVSIANGNAQGVVRLVAGFSAFRLSQYPQAVEHLQSIAAALPTDHPALRWLAASQLAIGEAEAAEQTFARVANPQAEDVRLVAQLSSSLMSAGLVEKGLAAWQTTEQLAVDQTDMIQLGALELSLGRVSGLLKLEQALATDSNDQQVQFALAQGYWMAQQDEQLREHLDRWQAANKLTPWPDYFRSQLALRAGQVDKAVTLLAAAYAHAEPPLRIMLAYVQALASNQQNEQAWTIAQAVINAYPESLVALQSYYQLAVINQQVAEAQAFLQSQLTQRNMAAHLLQAELEIRAGQPNMALTLLANIPQSMQISDEYRRLQGVALTQANKHLLAKAHYAEWLRLQPGKLAPLMGLLNALVNLEEYQLALTQLDRFRGNENIAIVQLARFFILIADQQWQPARTLFATFPSEVQNSVGVASQLSKLLIVEKDYLLAAEKALQAYRYRPNVNDLRWHTIALELAGRKDDALAFLEAENNTNGTNAIVKIMLAERLLSSQPDKAIKLYQQVIELVPNNVIALNNLAYLYAQQNQLAQGEQFARQAYQLAPNTAAIADTLADILNKEGKHHEAVELYRNILSMTSLNDQLYLNYIETLIYDQQIELARRHLQERVFKTSLERVNMLKRRLNI